MFVLDIEKDVLEYPELLLEFDEQKSSKAHQPSHTHDRIDIIDGSKTWITARVNWRSKVRKLLWNLGKDFPKPKEMSI